MGIRTTDAGGEPRGSCSGHVQQREDEVPQRIDGAGERVDAGDDGEPVAHRPDSSVRDLAERHATATPYRTAGPRGFSRTVPVTQRHAVDRHHLEADLRFSAAWTGLPEAHRSLVEVLVEAASSSACGHIRLELARDMQMRAFTPSAAMHRYTGRLTVLGRNRDCHAADDGKSLDTRADPPDWAAH